MMPVQISLCTLHGMQNTSFLSFMAYKLQILTQSLTGASTHPNGPWVMEGSSADQPWPQILFGRWARAPFGYWETCSLGMCAKWCIPSQFSVQNPCQSIPPPFAFEAECLALSSTIETCFALRSQSFQCFKRHAKIGTPTRTIYRPKRIPKDKHLSDHWRGEQDPAFFSCLNVSLPHPK